MITTNNTLVGKIENYSSLQGNLNNNNSLIGEVNAGESIFNYDDLLNKPKINDFELKGDISFKDLGISNISNLELENILK